MRRGFSIIELLVVVTILMLLGAGIVTNFNSYNENQKVKQSAVTLETDLRHAQSKALSGLRPAGCNPLNGYSVRFYNGSPSRYEIQANCGLPYPPGVSLGEIITIVLPQNVSFTPLPSTKTIRVLNRGVLNAGSIILRGLTRSYIISISSGGDITGVGP